MISSPTSLPNELVSDPIAQAPAVKPHLGVIDVLRAIAAISVCLFHLTGEVVVKFHSQTLEHTFSWGWLGVEIFLVISGFIIPYSMYGTNYRLPDFGSYFLKRVLRICPSAYVSMGLTILQLGAVSYLIHPDQALNLSVGRIISNLLFIAPFTGHEWFNGVFWTLCLEFQFYILIGLLFNQLFASPSPARFALIGLGLSAANYIPVLNHTSYFQYNALFMMGGATLLYFKRQIELPAYWILLGLFTGICAITAGSLAATFGAATALCIAFVRAGNAITAWLGKTSYALYLTHILVASSVDFLLSKFFHASAPLAHIVGVLISFAATIIGAGLYYYAVEQPLTRWVKRISFKPTPPESVDS